MFNEDDPKCSICNELPASEELDIYNLPREFLGIYRSVDFDAATRGEMLCSICYAALLRQRFDFHISTVAELKIVPCSFCNNGPITPYTTCFVCGASGLRLEKRSPLERLADVADED